VITALGSLAEPRPWPPEDGRTPAQRRADALVEICRRHLDTSDRPRIGGERPHLMVTISAAELAGAGLATWMPGRSAWRRLRRWALRCRRHRADHRPDGRPLRAGRRSRVIPPSLPPGPSTSGTSTAATPAARSPPARATPHHIHHWAHGGKNRSANLQTPVPTPPPDGSRALVEARSGSELPLSQQGSWGKVCCGRPVKKGVGGLVQEVGDPRGVHVGVALPPGGRTGSCRSRAAHQAVPTRGCGSPRQREPGEL